MRHGVVAKAVVVNDNKQILVIRRSKTDDRRPLEWDIPGGFVDPGESFEEACAREITEETGLNIPKERLSLIYANSEMRPFGNMTWLNFITKSSDTKINLSFEHDKFQWLSLDGVINSIDYHIQKQLFEYIRDNDLLKLTD